MNERHRRAQELFLAARELPPDARARFVASACGRDEALLREVESLLRVAEDTPESFLEPAPLTGSVAGEAPTLAAGNRLGPYEIIAPISSGGMGEVYRARDSRLHREVALKVLPAELSNDPERRRRLEREARAVAAINHPNICTLHDVGRDDGVDYLVFELVEGELLAAQLDRGPLPIDEALQRGAEIATALAAAHRGGVLHRDLKPANVMVAPTGAKLLDFGLAKLAVASPAPLEAGESMEDEGSLTRPGMLLGTVPYMTPEQIEGRPVDARTDVFALGVVLFEMLTGERPFTGETTMALVAAILEREPPAVSTFRPQVPAALDRTVARCLAKDPDRRWQSAADLADELAWIRDVEAFAPAAPTEKQRANWLGSAGWLLALALSIGLVASWLARAPPAPSGDPMRFRLQPEGFDPGIDTVNLAVSPAGDALVYGAWSDGARRLWLRRLDEAEAQVIPGTEGAHDPFWSPDGESVGFVVDDSIRVAGRSGGPSRVVLELEGGLFGPPSWGLDGGLLFCGLRSGRRGVYLVPIEGGSPEPVVTPEQTPGYTAHAWVQHLPDDRFQFLAFGGPERAALFLGSLAGEPPKPVREVHTRARWVEPGYLLYGQGSSLLARRFDPTTARWQGEPALLAERLPAGFPLVGQAPFTVSPDLLAVPQSEWVAEMAWFDRRGQELGTLGLPGDLASPRISPSGDRVAVSISDTRSSLGDLWIFEVARGVGRRLTSTREVEEAFPSWSPGGCRLVFASDEPGIPEIRVRSADGSGDDETLVEESHPVQPLDWSPDGALLLFEVADGADLWLAPIAGGDPRPYLRAPGRQTAARLSPDGRWVAFQSSELGSSQIFVAPLDDGDLRHRVSTEGGTSPVWGPDGRELFYARGREIVSVPVGLAPELTIGAPRELFRVDPPRVPVDFDVTPDGQRFLVTLLDEERAEPSLLVTVGWRASLEP